MTIRLHALTFDCADAAALGEFWAQALGRELDPGAGAEFASIGLRDAGRPESRWAFAQVPADLEAEVERLVGLGATWMADIKLGEMRWTTLQDPEGNEFDVIAEAA